MDLKEVRRGGMDGTDLLRKGWWTVVNAVMNLRLRNLRGFS